MKKLHIILAAALLFCACGGKQEASGLEAIETERFSIQTETAQIRDIEQELLLTGSVKAWEEATIFPRVAGKLLKNLLHEGDAVKRNQNIALIERDEVGAVYEPVVVPSTLTGVIGNMYLDPGANVNTTTPIALVVNQESARILIEIPERYVGRISMGQKAVFTLEAYGEREFEAVIYRLSPVVNAQNRVVSAELRADNKDGAIKSGMFAKVKLILKEAKGAVSVSLKSVYTDEADKKTYIFVLEGDRVKMTPVEAGIASDMYQEIKSGVKEGQEVAQIVFGLKDGSKINVDNPPGAQSQKVKSE
jgi:multidrug efflux pump subunit AcrA (membrane-fusion protein)